MPDALPLDLDGRKDAQPMHSASPGDTCEDFAIVARVRQGDREAFAVLVSRYQRMVLSLAMRMTQDRDAAQDVTQATFMNAFRRLDTFRGDASFKTWIYGIALNECRLVHRRSRDEPGLDEIPEPAARPSGGHPLDRVVLGKLVSRLPDKQRASLVLRICDDLSFREIAGLTHTSEASAKVNYFHAVRKLRAWLEPSPSIGGAEK